MTIEGAAHLGDLDVGDVVVAPDGAEWLVNDVYRESRFGMLVSVTIQRGTSWTIVDADPLELEWVGPNRWRWHPRPARGFAPEVAR